MYKRQIRDFVRRVERLNGYLTLLPCLYYSSKAAKSTKVVGPFDDPGLASHILRMVPWNWQDQYMSSLEPGYLRASGSYWKPLNASNEPSQSIRSRWAEGYSQVSDSSKRKMVSFDERIPKKHCREKHCLLPKYSRLPEV